MNTEPCIAKYPQGRTLAEIEASAADEAKPAPAPRDDVAEAWTLEHLVGWQKWTGSDPNEAGVYLEVYKNGSAEVQFGADEYQTRVTTDGLQSALRVARLLYPYVGPNGLDTEAYPWAVVEALPGVILGSGDIRDTAEDDE